MAMQLSDMTGMSSLLSDAMPEYGTNVNFNVFCMKEKSLGNGEVTFYKVQQLAFDEEYPHREAFENVLQSLENTAFNFIYLLDGDECGVNLYIGITKNQNENVQTSGKVLSAADYGKIIQCVFKGNFSGSKNKEATIRNCLQMSPKVFRRSPSKPAGWWELISYQEEIDKRDQRIRELAEENEQLKSVKTEDDFVKRLVKETKNL